MKKITTAILMMFSSIYGVEVDEEMFNVLTNKAIEECKDIDAWMSDSFDIYTYYFMLGKASGFEDSKVVFQDCKASNQCDCMK